MKTAFIITSILIFLSCSNTAKTKKEKVQQLSIESKDSLIFNSFIEYSKACPLNKISNTATFFINTPYMGGTLDINKKEQLVINLRELDCLTFVENVLALYLCRKNNNISIPSFTENIENMRYRNGKLDGYESRLHYSTDWLYDNTEKGIIKDITKEIGGTPFIGKINFMSEHSNKYKALKSKKVVNRIKSIEDKINSRQYFYIPKSDIAQIESKIENGDIILITTNIEGLDIAHVGYAINLNNRIHLIHASSQYKKVVISPYPLNEYLKNIDHHTGIMVARVY